MAEGLPTKTPLAEKLWRASRILDLSPFDPQLLAHTEPQIDFILEMYAIEHPKEFRFRRAGKLDEGIAVSIAQRDWANVLIGDALRKYLGERMPSAAVLSRIRDNMPRMQRGKPPPVKVGR